MFISRVRLIYLKRFFLIDLALKTVFSLIKSVKIAFTSLLVCLQKYIFHVKFRGFADKNYDGNSAFYVNWYKLSLFFISTNKYRLFD